MKASIVDLRYRMKDVLKALEGNEEVSILHHGKTKGVITAHHPKGDGPVTEHPFFGMRKDEEGSVAGDMDELRGGRNRDF